MADQGHACHPDLHNAHSLPRSRVFLITHNASSWLRLISIPQGPDIADWDKSIGNVVVRFGREGDVPLPFDYFNEGKPRLAVWRSEEHTSELQSLMRISYAVFCLK